MADGAPWYLCGYLAGIGLLSALSTLWLSRMYGAERLYVGSPYTVRGFRETPVGGDCGGYMRNELAWTVPAKILEPVKASPLGPVQIYAAYDYGGISRDAKDPYEWGELTGMRQAPRLRQQSCIAKNL